MSSCLIYEEFYGYDSEQEKDKAIKDALSNATKSGMLENLLKSYD